MYQSQVRHGLTWYAHFLGRRDSLGCGIPELLSAANLLDTTAKCARSTVRIRKGGLLHDPMLMLL